MNIPKRQHTDPVFKKLRIMKIEDLIKFELCKLAYQVKENLLPKPILDLFNVNKNTLDIILGLKMYLTYTDIGVMPTIRVSCVRVCVISTH